MTERLTRPWLCGPFSCVPIGIYYDLKLTSGQIALYELLCVWADVVTGLVPRQRQEAASALGCAASSLRAHVAKLRKAGLVALVKEGLRVLAPAALRLADVGRDSSNAAGRGDVALVPQAVTLDGGLGGCDRRVYGALASRAGQHTATTWVSAQRLASDLGVSKDTVSRSLRRLQQRGHIERWSEGARTFTRLIVRKDSDEECPGKRCNLPSKALQTAPHNQTLRTQIQEQEKNARMRAQHKGQEQGGQERSDRPPQTPGQEAKAVASKAREVLGHIPDRCAEDLEQIAQEQLDGGQRPETMIAALSAYAAYAKYLLPASVVLGKVLAHWTAPLLVPRKAPKHSRASATFASEIEVGRNDAPLEPPPLDEQEALRRSQALQAPLCLPSCHHDPQAQSEAIWARVSPIVRSASAVMLADVLALMVWEGQAELLTATEALRDVLDFRAMPCDDPATALDSALRRTRA